MRSKPEDSEYFFAAKRLNSLQALLSVVSSETSVATTVIFPAAGFAGGYVLVWLLLGYIVGRIIFAKYYLRALYESSRLTIYQTISVRHRMLEVAYLLAKYISGGARYFVGAYALHQILGGSIIAWVLAIACCVAAYSLTGGLRAVVAMDQIQSVLIVGTGLFLVLYFGCSVPYEALKFPSILELDPTRYTFSPILFLGGAVLSIGSHGADQDLLLRVLSTKSFKDAQRSLVLSGFGAAFLISLYLLIGYFLRLSGATGLDPKSPLADFIMRDQSQLLKGVFLVLLAAAAMSSLDSTIHSTGAIWKSLMRSNKPGRLWSSLSLLIMVSFAMLFMMLNKHRNDFLTLFMGSMNYVNGGLIGIVTVFTFYRDRLTSLGIPAGLAGGFLVTLTCEWGFKHPVPWTYTVLFSSFASLMLCLYASNFDEKSKGDKDNKIPSK
jgi:Na+/proline symporter